MRRLLAVILITSLVLGIPTLPCYSYAKTEATFTDTEASASLPGPDMDVSVSFSNSRTDAAPYPPEGRGEYA